MNVTMTAIYTPDSTKQHRPEYLNITPTCPEQRQWIVDYMRANYGSKYNEWSASIELSFGAALSDMGQQLWGAFFTAAYASGIIPNNNHPFDVGEEYRVNVDVPHDIIRYLFSIRPQDWNNVPMTVLGGTFSCTCTSCGATMTEQGGSCYCPPYE